MVLDNSICNRFNRSDLQSFETLRWNQHHRNCAWLPGTFARTKIWATGGGLHSQCHIATRALWYQAARWEWSTPEVEVFKFSRFFCWGGMTLECQDWDAYWGPMVSQTQGFCWICCFIVKLFFLRLSWGIPSIPSLWCPKPWPPNCMLICAKLHSFFRRSQRSEALVAIDTLAHGVLSDLLSATGNNMDITCPVFLDHGKKSTLWIFIKCKTSIRSISWWATEPCPPHNVTWKILFKVQ